MTTTLGIDPGLDGALALLRPNGELHIEDMPTLQLSSKRVIDEHRLAAIVDGFGSMSAGSVVYLERVGSRPGEGHVGAFSFGQGYGLLRGVCVANFLPIVDVTPASWKRAMGVKGDKDESRQRASQLLPRHVRHWPLKKHHGRAEAALLALYGAQRALKAAA